MSRIDEIAPDVFRISTFVEPSGLQFNQFLVRDDEPLLYHTLQNALFDEVLDAVRSLMDPATLRWIGFSHFEGDECGSLNRWLSLAPRATALAGAVAAQTCINDFAARPPRVLADDATFVTGRHRFQLLVTPYVPHNWESTLLFDATAGTLFCSDLLLQRGHTDALSPNILEHSLADFAQAQRGPFHDSIPWAQTTPGIFARLAKLAPHTLAIMHGASFEGEGANLLTAYAGELQRLLGSHMGNGRSATGN